MGQYDKTIKIIFSDMTEALVKLMTGNEIKKKEELNLEFTRVEKRQSDMVLKSEMDGTDTAIHIEFQSSNDTKMPYRMLRYSLEILEKHNLPVYQLVLYMGKEKMKMQSNLNYFFDVNNMLNYKYNIVDIGELKFSDIVGNEAYALYALLPIIDRERREREKVTYLKDCVKAIKNSPIPIEEKKEIAFRAELLAGLTFEKQTIERIFMEVMSMLRIEDSVVYQDIIAKGIEKGKKEGLEKGKGQGKVEIVLKQLKRKFKTLPRLYEEKLSEVEEDTIERIAEDIFEIEDVKDLDKYLQ